MQSSLPGHIISDDSRAIIVHATAPCLAYPYARSSLRLAPQCHAFQHKIATLAPQCLHNNLPDYIVHLIIIGGAYIILRALLFIA